MNNKCAYHKKPLGACYQCISDGIVEAVAQMQERCAKVAEEHIKPVRKDMSSPCYYHQVHECAEDIAAAIREVKP